MSLQDWSAIAQIAASVAVVVSLIYLARQLRQSNALMRVGASGERVQRDFDISQLLIEHPDIAEIWLKGQDRFEELSAVERIRLVFFERRAIVHWHNMFHLRQENLLPESDWLELNFLIATLGRRQAIRETWKMFRGAFEPAFQKLLDPHLLDHEQPHSAE